MPEQQKEPAHPEERQSTSDLANRIRDLEAALAATRAGQPLTQVPEHGGGVGTELAETWSQYDQELAAAGEHPDQPKPDQAKRV
jgi:hypothetical protein